MEKKSSVLIAGGAGYIGSRLVPELVEQDYAVTVLDLCWFGCNLPKDVPLIQKDVFEITDTDLEGFDAVIFLAGLSNDPMAEYSPAANFISNAAAPAYLAYQAKQVGISRYIYADSCSVYGYVPGREAVESDVVTSDYPYGISKLQGEFGVLQSSDDTFSVICLRQGTVSGYSPRMRFDLFVNTMYMKASTEGVITVNNPKIWRPLLPVSDAVSAYVAALEAPKEISGVFNIAAENYTVGSVAEKIAQHFQDVHDLPVKVDTRNIDDKRNYRVSTEKAKNELRIEFSGSVESILQELDERVTPDFAFDEDRYYNIRIFKKIADKVSYLK